jgi:hypothetical protein
MSGREKKEWERKRMGEGEGENISWKDNEIQTNLLKSLGNIVPS